MWAPAWVEAEPASKPGPKTRSSGSVTQPRPFGICEIGKGSSIVGSGPESGKDQGIRLTEFLKEPQVAGVLSGALGPVLK